MRHGPDKLVFNSLNAIQGKMDPMVQICPKMAHTICRHIYE